MTEDEIIKETRKLIGQWDNVRISGQGWSGDARRGFQFNPIAISTGVGGVGPITPSGACCPEEGDCFIATQSVCEDGGGTYQGDDTTCDPDPCPPRGACCVGTDCTIETEGDCIGMGGTYQGDDTTCDPNPCGACCSFGFDDFLGMGRKFLAMTVVTDATDSRSPAASGHVTITDVYIIDPITCDVVCSRSCSGSDTVNDFFGGMWVECYTCTPSGTTCGIITQTRVNSGNSPACSPAGSTSSDFPDIALGPIFAPLSNCIGPPAGGTETTTETTYTYDKSTGDITGTVTATLSDECIP